MAELLTIVEKYGGWGVLVLAFVAVARWIKPWIERLIDSHMQLVSTLSGNEVAKHEMLGTIRNHVVETHEMVDQIHRNVVEKAKG